MLRPAISQLITKDESYYSLVVAVAKRAREISDEMLAKPKDADEKGIKQQTTEFISPVKVSVAEFASGKCRFVEDPSLQKSKEE